MTRSWRVSLTAAAEADFQNAIRWSLQRFGRRQAAVYRDVLIATLQDLAEGPDVVGAHKRDDILKGLHSLHVARKGRKGRHFVLFRAVGLADQAYVEVLRILDHAMDLPRQFTDEEEP